MDIKAEEIPPGIGWNELSEEQKQVIDAAMIRFLPIFHERNTIQHWFVARRLVAFYQGHPGTRTPWRLAYQLDKTKMYRVVCDVDPQNQQVSWHVARLQFRPITTPELTKYQIPSVVTKEENTKAIRSTQSRPGSARGN
jgi:hypothetical protein